MNTELETALSNNNLRRMQGWARGKYPKDAPDRCAVVIEYLAQLSDEDAAGLIKQGWEEVFAAAERNWPEAFAGWKQAPAEQA